MEEVIKEAGKIVDAEETKAMNEFLEAYKEVLDIQAFVEILNLKTLISFKKIIDFEIKSREILD